MHRIPDIQRFLQQYHRGESYPTSASVPTEGDQPTDAVRSAQQTTGKDPDEHVIPASAFEYRFDTDGGPSWNEIRIDENIHLIERYWDTLIGQYGLGGVVTYLPFHQNQATYGIYISQRGIRFLGHLLYNWSKVIEPDDGSSRVSPQSMPMRKGHLIAGKRLEKLPAAFESLQGAFNLAYEIIRRYAWFHHQVELLGAYLEDARRKVCYPLYHQQYQAIDAPEADLCRAVGHLYVARSRACQNEAPIGLLQPLLERALGAFKPPTDTLFLDASNGFERGRRELSKGLRDGFQSSSRSTPIELSQHLPFSTDIDRAIPERIALYITRRESDSDNDSFANRPGVISLSNQTTYAIRESQTYAKKV